MRQTVLRLTAAMLLSAACMAQTGTSQQQSTEYINPDREIYLVPYLWFSGINGTVGAANQTVSLHAPFSDVFSQLNFGLMGFFYARKNRLSFSNDLIYVSLSDDKALEFTPGLTAKFDSKLLIDTPTLGLRLINQPGYWVEALAGIRFWHLDSNLTVAPFPKVGQTQDWVDPIVGMNGGIKFGGQYFTILEGDVGGWGVGADQDWQLLGSLGRKFGKHISGSIAYRYLSVDYRHQGFLYDTTTQGPLLGIGFHW